jgi:hypothetical protein
MPPMRRCNHDRIYPCLLVILIGLVVDDVEEAELIYTLRGGNDAEPVTELLLLEELLGAVKIVSRLLHVLPLLLSTLFDAKKTAEWYDNVQVLQVAARELLVSNDLDLAVSLLADLDVVAEVSGAAFNLDAVVEELLEGLDVEDLIVDRLGAVDDELRCD